jgi:hypothetical protein
VFRRSQAKLGARLTLLVLADAAHEDGIAYPKQRLIAEKAKLSISAVERAIADLQTLGELQVRKAQRGRRRINVYRITLSTVEPDYDILPFKLVEPFTTPQYEGPSNSDDPAERGATTPQAEGSHARAPNEALNRNPEPEELAARAPRKRDIVFDALAKATFSDPHLEGGLIGKEVAKLRKHPAYIAALELHGKDVVDAALAEEIPRRAAMYREHFGPGIELTAPALVKHWKRVQPQTRPKSRYEQAQENLRRERGEA